MACSSVSLLGMSRLLLACKDGWVSPLNIYSDIGRPNQILCRCLPLRFIMFVIENVLSSSSLFGHLCLS